MEFSSRMNMSGISQILPPQKGVPYAPVIAQPNAKLSDLAPQETIGLLETHGAVLLRGFQADIDAFCDFSDPFCSGWVINESRNRDLLDGRRHVQTADRGIEPFALHSEISRSPWRPDVCFFFCVRPPTLGGETTICDGIGIAEALSPDLRNALLRYRLVYLREITPALLAYWLGTENPTPTQLANPPSDCPFKFIGEKDRILSLFTRPALQRSLFLDAPAFANFVLFARDMHKNHNFPLLSDGRQIPETWVDEIRLRSEELTAEIRWRQGDLLILDNSRFMHGRRRVIDDAERIIASRFGYLRSAPVSNEEPKNPVWRRDSFRPPKI